MAQSQGHVERFAEEEWPRRLVIEGSDRIGHSLATAFTAAALPSVLGPLPVVVVATLVGYGMGKLLPDIRRTW